MKTTILLSLAVISLCLQLYAVSPKMSADEIWLMQQGEIFYEIANKEIANK